MARSNAAVRWLAPVALALAVPAWAENWPDANLPAGTAAAAVSPRMIYNGADMRSQVFTSTLPSQDILDWYQKQWGKDWVRDSVSGWEIIGHRQGDYYVTVQVRPDGKGSRGDIGMVRIPPAGTRPKPVGVGVIRPSDTQVVNDISYPDDATPARTVAMSNKLSVWQNAGYYREHLAADGWNPSEKNQCNSGSTGCVLAFEQGARKMMIAVTGDDTHSDIVMNTVGE